jgi:hypothetical protein
MTIRRENSNDLQAEAERAVAAIEALALGELTADHVENAMDAVAEYSDPAFLRLFKPFVLASADHIAVFEFYEGGWTRERYVECCADLHVSCFEADPALAEFLRSGPILERVQGAGAAHASIVARPSVDLADEFRARYVRIVAAHLAGVAAYEPHATTLSVHAPALEARVAACRTRHDEYRRGELERLERERAAADEVLAADERARRAAVARFFAARHGQRFVVRDRVYSGVGLSHAVQGIGVRDQESEEFSTLRLEELEVLLRRTEAAEAVTA